MSVLSLYSCVTGQIQGELSQNPRFTSAVQWKQSGGVPAACRRGNRNKFYPRSSQQGPWRGAWRKICPSMVSSILLAILLLKFSAFSLSPPFFYILHLCSFLLFTLRSNFCDTASEVPKIWRFYALVHLDPRHSLKPRSVTLLAQGFHLELFSGPRLASKSFDIACLFTRQNLCQSCSRKWPLSCV